MAIRQELVEGLLAGRDPSEVFAHDGLLDELKRALAERMLDAELDQHLASERAGSEGRRMARAITGMGTAANGADGDGHA